MLLSEDIWQSPAESPVVAREGEIDLWRIDLDRSIKSGDSLYGLLSSDEKERADRFVFQKDRDHFIAGRAALRKILGRYIGLSPQDVRFAARHFGKPYLSPAHDLRFNVSHSKGIAIVAVAKNQEVGVDIEFVDRSFDIFSVASSVFRADEVLKLKELSPESQAAAFFAGWTRKEALLKAMGDGLSSSDELQDAVSMIGERDVSYRSVEGDKVTHWSLTSFEINNSKAALVVEGKITAIRYWQFEAELPAFG
jgi:4'-phosphopantetheinyl transferase